MIPVMQSSYFSDMLDSAWSSVPAIGIDEKVLADTLVTPGEEINTATYYPVRTSDDRAEADRPMIDMLCADVPLTVIRFIVRSDSFDILPPKDATTAPFLVITYADEMDEDICIANNNWQPRQDASFLQVPEPGMTAKDREESEDLEVDEDTWAGFEWTLDVDVENYDYSSVDMLPTLTPDSPFGIPIESIPGWPSDSNTRYFVGCTRRRGVESTAEWLDIRTSATESCATTDPWKPIRFGFIPAFTPHVVEFQSKVGTKSEVEDWSDDFEVGEEGGLEIDGQDDDEVDNSYEEDATMHEDTGSDLAELTDSENEDEPRIVIDC